MYVVSLKTVISRKLTMMFSEKWQCRRAPLLAYFSLVISCLVIKMDIVSCPSSSGLSPTYSGRIPAAVDDIIVVEISGRQLCVRLNVLPH